MALLRRLQLAHADRVLMQASENLHRSRTRCLRIVRGDVLFARPRPRTPQGRARHKQRHRSRSQHEPPVGAANPPCNTLIGRRKTLPVICSTGRVRGRVNSLLQAITVDDGCQDRLWSDCHVDGRICPVGLGRYHSPCQFSRHQDLLGAAGPNPLHERHCRVASIT